MADVELMSPTEVKAVVAGLVRENKALTSSVDAMQRGVDDLKAAMKDDRQRNAELAERARPTVSGFDAFVGKGIAQNGSTLRLGDEENPDGAGEMLPGLLSAKTVDDWHAEVKRWTEIRTMCKALPERARSKSSGIPHRKADAVLARLFTDEAPAVIRSALEPLQREIKADRNRESAFIAKIFNDTANVGAEFIPDVTMPILWETLVAERRIEALFGTMNMSNKTEIYPFRTTGLRPYIKGANTSDSYGSYTASTPATDSRTFTATGLAVRAIVDEDASEDSIIASEALFRQMLAEALTDATEDAILNGDSNATHQDTGIAAWNIRSRWGSTGLGTSADHRFAWLGLRADAIDNSNTADKSAAQTFAGIQSLRTLLASPQGLGGDCVIITSPEWFIAKLSQLAEVVTLEKYGSQATILTGEASKIGGMPVILSEFMDCNLNASGIFDNSTLDYTGALVLNRKRWVMGVRRGVMIESQKEINSGVWNYVATVRKVFKKVDSSTAKSVAYGYKLSKS